MRDSSLTTRLRGFIIHNVSEEKSPATEKEFGTKFEKEI